MVYLAHIGRVWEPLENSFLIFSFFSLFSYSFLFSGSLFIFSLYLFSFPLLFLIFSLSFSSFVAASFSSFFLFFSFLSLFSYDSHKKLCMHLGCNWLMFRLCLLITSGCWINRIKSRSSFVLSLRDSQYLWLAFELQSYKVCFVYASTPCWP